ncbi:hypothetical protein AZ78_4219 [Lysobacter capsici AZ78]|uniref:Uncharacterized protein n=1 Tax=Lysobacter capsici AZ78 TaxID=1444315 RepID=A0A120AHT4_9GAMM|nr:hypothetical protein AZ78_4219 [Lysobacter capsici AZ78]
MHANSEAGARRAGPGRVGPEGADGKRGLSRRRWLGSSAGDGVVVQIVAAGRGFKWPA